MKTECVEAQSIKPGDYIYDNSYYADNKWVKVLEVSKDEYNYIILNVGHCKIIRYALTGITRKILDNPYYPYTIEAG